MKEATNRLMAPDESMYHETTYTANEIYGDASLLGRNDITEPFHAPQETLNEVTYSLIGSHKDAFKNL
jgi:hypothetical protein